MEERRPSNLSKKQTEEPADNTEQFLSEWKKMAADSDLVQAKSVELWVFLKTTGEIDKEIAEMTRKTKEACEREGISFPDGKKLDPKE